MYFTGCRSYLPSRGGHEAIVRFVEKIGLMRVILAERVWVEIWELSEISMEHIGVSRCGQEQER